MSSKCSPRSLKPDLLSLRPAMHAGHVTAGGSICTEALTLSGSPSGWQPSLTVEAVLMETISSMVDCEVSNASAAAATMPNRGRGRGRCAHWLQSGRQQQRRCWPGPSAQLGGNRTA